MDTTEATEATDVLDSEEQGGEELQEEIEDEEEREGEEEEVDEDDLSEEALERRKQLKALLEKPATFSQNIVELQHNFGYDCKRLFNLVLIDDYNLVFASGNFLHYFNLETGKVTFRPSEFGYGIGFITKNEHPDFTGLLTVGENGPNATVFVYEWPKYTVRVKMEKAAKSCFTCGSYNATGDLFASQAGPPDFMLTIWRWETTEVILRAKSFQNIVLHVHFSRYNSILLVSCGMSHIKFWKMAKTFTGLKLKGDLGRFGKTDFSDIYAIYMLSDENVISGCEWGNMLLWEAGLIKFEITRKGRKPCHAAPITRITMENGEVTTVGMDGFVRIWFWETIDTADPPDEDRFVEIEPIYEFKIGDSEIKGIQKIKPFDEEDTTYYVQDGRGGIWFCDLNTNDVPKESKKLYSCPGGKIIVAQTSPISPHIICMAQDGKIFVYNYKNIQLVIQQRFHTIGTDLLWFNTKMAPNGMEIGMTFDDGVLRLFFIDVEKKMKLLLTNVFKGHTAPLTKLTVNRKNTLLITGSTDKTFFVYKIAEPKTGYTVALTPLGFVELDSIPRTFYWRTDRALTVYIATVTGEVYESSLPLKVAEEYTYLSYNITELVQLRKTKFTSVKSRIRRDLRRLEIKKRKERKRRRKLKQVELLKKANPGLQIDMEQALADSEPDEEEPPLHIPPIPNPVLWLRLTPRETIWVSMAGYDAGYIYELTFHSKEPVHSTIIKDADDIEIQSYLNIERYLLFGLQNGKLRINLTTTKDFTDLHDYRVYNMHDRFNGIISNILLTFDKQKLFTVGYDGNIFMYRWNGPTPTEDMPMTRTILPTISSEIEDIDEASYPSLEQEKIYAEIKRQEDAARAHELKVLGHISELQVYYNGIVRDNATLPSQLKFHQSELLLDERITNQIKDELIAELEDVREDLAYDLEFATKGKEKLYNNFLKQLDHIPITLRGIDYDMEVRSFRVLKLSERYEEARGEIEERLRLEALRRLRGEFITPEEKEDSIGEPPPENFFYGRDPDTILPRFSKKMLRLLTRYRARQLYEVERLFNWSKLEKRRPDPDKNHPDDIEKIKQAERTIGDYKLKIGADYEPSSDETLTTKYVELFNCRQELFNIQNNFNQLLFGLQKEKEELYAFIKKQRKRLNIIHFILPKPNHKELPFIPDINMHEEYPEKNLIEHYKPGVGIEIQDILYLEKSINDLMPKEAEPFYVPEYTLAEKFEFEKYYALEVDQISAVPSLGKILDEIDRLPKSNEAEFYERKDNQPSPFLIEMRYKWLVELLKEQEEIILQIRDRIRRYNDALKDLCYIRLRTKFDIEFMQCYMITLNQELEILRDSEEIENELQNNADNAMRGRNQMQITINQSNRQIDECRKAIDRINDQIASIQLTFMSTCKGHKFYDFLRRIFKKKWRPPKPPKGDDETSESSESDDSSSEEEVDAKSMDSADMTTIRLDETTCPTGLERPLYELAFKMRSDRHALEKTHSEQTTAMMKKRQEVQELHKAMKFNEELYEREKETLLIFRRKRQAEMNKIKMSVVLYMSKIQHFNEGEDYNDLSRAVLFDSDKLTKLKNRVAQLNIERIETRRLHRINIIHLRRMEVDIKFMRYEITRLETEIKEEMMKKFGMVIKLDDLEEEVLRKYVFDLETTAEEELRLIEKEYAARKRVYAQYQEQLIQDTNLNTKKLKILTILTEEKNFLNDILSKQELKFVEWMKPPRYNLDGDIDRLKVAHRQQLEQIENLEREICTLRMKSKPLSIIIDDVITKEPTAQYEKDKVPAFLSLENYDLRLKPDAFIMEKIRSQVLKSMIKIYSRHMSKDEIRKYGWKIACYVGQSCYSLQGKPTHRIMDAIKDGILEILPKKFHEIICYATVHQFFVESLEIFDLDRTVVKTEELMAGIFEHATETMKKTPKVHNKTQFMIETMLKEMIELMPLDEFRSRDTKVSMFKLLIKEKYVDPRCINIDNCVERVVEYALENMLEKITMLPIRQLVEYIYDNLIKEIGDKLIVKCSDHKIPSLAVSVKIK